MALFEDMVCYQEEVRDPSRMAEVLNRVIEKAWRGSRAGADQRAARLLDPGRSTSSCRRSCGSSGRPAASTAIAEAARLLSEAQLPGHPQRRRRGARQAPSTPRAGWPKRLDAPVCCGYQHNDAFPGSHPPGGRAARLQRLEGGDGADRQGRRGAGARHAAQPVLDAARLRHRLLAEERQDHPGRHQCRPHRPDQEGDGRHPGRRQAGRRADPRAAWRRRPAMRAVRSARR